MQQIAIKVLMSQEMEAAGIAPASREASAMASTCVADRLIFGLRALIGKVPVGLSRHEFNPSRNGRLGSGDPASNYPVRPCGSKLSDLCLGFRAFLPVVGDSGRFGDVGSTWIVASTA